MSFGDGGQAHHLSPKREDFFPLLPTWAELRGRHEEVRVRAGSDGARTDPIDLPGAPGVIHSSLASPRPAQERDIWERGTSRSCVKGGHGVQDNSLYL